jgi:glycosyltransferase involved in cell wall biosynthesis
VKLAFHYHTSAYVQEDGIYVPAYLGLFLDSIAANVVHLRLLLHTSPVREELHDYRLKTGNVSLCDFGAHMSIPSRMRNWRKYADLITKESQTSDALLLRASTPLLPIFRRQWGSKTFLMLVSDATSGLSQLPQPWFRLQLIKLWAHWYAHEEALLAKSVPVIVNSAVLFNTHKRWTTNLKLLTTTTLSDSDLFRRDDTCLEDSVRLVSVGRIAETKGLLELIDALAILCDRGVRAQLRIVGNMSGAEPFVAKATASIEALGLGDRVTWVGYKPAGSILLEEYRQADIFIMASKSQAEGFPRTIWEALASSTPSVVTDVGSVRAFVEDCVIIIPPGCSTSIADSVERYIADSGLRQKLIAKGIEKAKENTLDRQAAALVRYLSTVKQI